MPKRDMIRRIDQRPRGEGGYTGGVWQPSGTGGTDDERYVWRNGTRSLYAAARWLWDTGAEVAGVLRSRGEGFLQVIGLLYSGRAEGPRAGIGEYTTDANQMSAVIEAVGSDNVPVFSAGAPDNGDPDSAWVNIGREGYPRIALGQLAPYDRQVPRVPAVLISGTITGSQIDTASLAQNLQVPIVDSLSGLSYGEGQLFMLRAGTDSGVLYQWTRWGPEPVGGFHGAGPHTHANYGEGDQLQLSNALIDVSILGPVYPEVLTYDTARDQWANLRPSAPMVYLLDTEGYFVSNDVEGALQYLAAWLMGVPQ